MFKDSTLSETLTTTTIIIIIITIIIIIIIMIENDATFYSPLSCPSGS